MATTYDDVVALTADLPMVETRQWYGTPGVGVKGKGFCRMWSAREYRRDGVDPADTEVLVVMGELESKEMILESSGGACFETPHYEGHGAFLVRLADIDPDELRDLLEDAYRTKAPVRAIKELDARSAPPAS